jgi:hypothetical protein
MFITVFKIALQCVIFQVLKAASMKMTVFWDVAPCSLMEFYHQGNKTLIALMVEAVSTSET